MTSATKQPLRTSVAEARGAFAPEGRGIRVDQPSARPAETQPHEDVVEFLLEQYRDVMIELADR